MSEWKLYVGCIGFLSAALASFASVVVGLALTLAVAIVLVEGK